MPQAIKVHALVDSLRVGGAEALLAQFASTCSSAGIQLTVGYLREWSAADVKDRLRRAGVEPQLVGAYGMRPDGLRRVRAHLRQVAPDVLHTHLAYSDVLGGLAARSLGIPSVSTLHGMEWEWATRGRRADLRVRLAAIARRRCAVRVIAVSEEVRRSYVKAGLDSAARVVVIPSGISSHAQPGAGRAVRASLGLEPHHRVVMMLSALRAEKGHDVGCAAIQRVRESVPDVRLVIVGDGPARHEVASHASALSGHAVLAGHRDDVMACLDAADVLLQPSHSEAFGVSLLEAMAARVPIIASAVGGMTEIVTHEQTGLLVSPGEGSAGFAAGVERLLLDTALCTRLAHGGHERFVDRYRADRWAARSRGVYEEALSDAAGTSSARVRDGLDRQSSNTHG